ncbi:PAS domain-containing protein [Bizionia sediminis]|uniref:PAS domain-containing protein n=1 Tax=Bizionia sediminis TaxID=1737064 RepID=A0ABW5KNX1_9FLAO
MKHELSNMMCLDIYLSSLSAHEYKRIHPELQPVNTQNTGLISWDIISDSYTKKLENLRLACDKEKVKAFARKARWENKLDAIFKNETFEAIIITNLEQKILWVNSGFTTMTGYTKKDALNKTPNFLQGQQTSKETKKNIRKNLNNLKPFTEIVTNYRKDKSTYACEVKIFPMYNALGVTHFLALEKQVGQ